MTYYKMIHALNLHKDPEKYFRDKLWVRLQNFIRTMIKQYFTLNYEIGQVNIAVLESLRAAFFCNASFLFSSIYRCLSTQAIANILNSL